MPWIDAVDEFASPPRVSTGPTGPEEWDDTFETIYGVDRVESVTIDAVTIDATEHGTVELLDCELSGATLETGSSSRFVIADSILTGCDLSRARIETVRYGASLEDVSIAGSTLQSVIIDAARFQRVDLRGATALDLVGVGELGGCLITDVQALQLATHLALAAGASLERES